MSFIGKDATADRQRLAALRFFQECAEQMDGAAVRDMLPQALPPLVQAAEEAEHRQRTYEERRRRKGDAGDGAGPPDARLGELAAEALRAIELKAGAKAFVEAYAAAKRSKDEKKARRKRQRALERMTGGQKRGRAASEEDSM